MHKNEVAVDLKISRRESGLSNKDVAHLLAVDCARVSRLETGKTKPTVEELCALTLVYGEQLDGLLSCSINSMVQVLSSRLHDVPAEPENWKRQHDSRLRTLQTLYLRLEELTQTQPDV